ncbi:MAG: phosphate signaling complex protein PhoU [Lachnospiraceae bacterium]|nr:phosphate signaling complex protein PhoU [Lachnospiraceae bacterium]
MRSKFEEQLRNLNREMIDMGIMIENSIKESVEALNNGDVETAKKIMEGDVNVDHQQKKIENICFNLLIQQQPVARDLRTITAAMKMVTDMERIGDHAADISEMTIYMKDKNPLNNYEHIGKMAAETIIMLNHSLEAYVERDRDKAKEVIEHDNIVDELFNSTKGDIINLIRNNPEGGEEAVDLLMVAKYFERIGDHATNIAEWVIYALNTKADA